MTTTGDSPQSASWISLPSHRAWLDREGDRLLAFAEAAGSASTGFAWLDDEGRPDAAQAPQLWITARMTHVFALAHLRGRPGAGPLVDTGLAALTGPFRDAEHGGWYSSLTPPGEPAATAKSAYDHAFVVLAAASATAAGRPGAADLLQEALAVVEQHFWRDDEGRSVESWDRTWTELEAYRGANSNMHTVEAFLTVAAVTGDERWLARATSIAERLVHTAARDNGWRLPEHFDPEWRPLPDYNAERKNDKFRPYGSTPGHWLEWSRLLLHLEAALGADAPDWLLPDARSLFDAAVEVGWAPDGEPGFVYTLDWSDRPVVASRLHWVLTEAIGAAGALVRRTGEPGYERWYRTFWDEAVTRFVDRDRGSWVHELPVGDADAVWTGKPDVYHAYQATLLPQLPLAPVLAAALRQEPGAG
ncbi:AGE family epimerase/isomerase [Blastococcus saxobsidens]|uniref:Mannose/cellobiose epimerase-like protein (N-acyl-D-glucosamine 2-epimerase family) n=1 Tax=Blastococcus saxobsidens TaxID=138336 RepID=A0A4Q7Y6M5_9ACTN|nr:AGE family epimerase/isomerase [Blastococcus saxobsidens]RZU32154.1 mannose/cellobiose epimerase-like protein (N-acyl-D-glucosamine 2-epimerase family) [Blastococcus saxobsidens]